MCVIAVQITSYETVLCTVQVKHITGTTADIFLEYIQRNLPEGVDMSVYQEELDSLPAMLTGPPEGEETASSVEPAKGKRNKSK